MTVEPMKLQSESQFTLMEPPIDTNKPKLDDRFLMNIKGKDFVQYAGLLDLAHQHGLFKLEVEHLQFPNKENNHVAICRAVATSKTGAVFSDIADADPGNVNKMIAPHILRMASTRAKARALRDLCNIGITSLEELGSLDDVIEDNGASKANHRSQTKPRKENGQRDSSQNETPHTTPAVQSDIPNTTEAKNGVLPKLSEAQRRAIFNLSTRRGIKESELESMSMKSYGVSVNQLTTAHASAFIRTLQQTG